MARGLFDLCLINVDACSFVTPATSGHQKHPRQNQCARHRSHCSVHQFSVHYPSAHLLPTPEKNGSSAGRICPGGKLLDTNHPPACPTPGDSRRTKSSATGVHSFLSPLQQVANARRSAGRAGHTAEPTGDGGGRGCWLTAVRSRVRRRLSCSPLLSVPTAKARICHSGTCLPPFLGGHPVPPPACPEPAPNAKRWLGGLDAPP